MVLGGRGQKYIASASVRGILRHLFSFEKPAASSSPRCYIDSLRHTRARLSSRADPALRAMATVRICRLRHSVIRSHHYLSLSSTENLNWPKRIQDLLEVHVDKDNGLPGYVCSSCKRRIEVLEKAAAETSKSGLRCSLHDWRETQAHQGD